MRRGIIRGEGCPVKSLPEGGGGNADDRYSHSGFVTRAQKFVV